MNILLLLIKVTVLLGGALALVFMLGRANPRWRLLVCEVAVVGLLVLPALSLIPLSLPLPMGDPGTGASGAEQFGVEEGIVSAPLTSETEGTTRNAGEAAEASAPPVLTGDSAGSEPPQGRALVIAGLTVYLLVIVFLAVRYARATRRLKVVLSTLVPAGGVPQDILTRVARELGLPRAPRLLVAEESIAPLACRSKGGTVIVPRVLVEPGQEEALRLTLRHEVHHLANGDLWRVGLLHFVAMMLWFHPFMWALRRSHLAAIEEVSDRVAAGEDGLPDYSRTLAKFALALRAERQLGTVSIGWFSRPQILKRLRSLKRRVPHTPLAMRSKFLAVVAVAAPVVLVISTLGFAQPRQQPAKQTVSPGLTGALPKEDRKATEKMAKGVLGHLVKLQHEDGSIAQENGGARSQETGLTAMTGMAFLLHGGANPESAYHKPMLRCRDFVLAAQEESGYFGVSLYHHAIATWFLASVKDKMQSGQERTELALKRAVRILLDAQAVKKHPSAQGGWRYTPLSRDSDLSCSAWALRALLVAKEAGQEVPQAAIDGALKFVRGLQGMDGGFSYTAAGIRSSVPLTGMALYLFERTGNGESPEAAKAAAFLMKNPPNPGAAKAPPYEIYGLYWTAAAMSLRGGEDARAYATQMFAFLAQRQQADGSFRGGMIPALSSICSALALAPGSPRELDKRGISER